MTKELVNAVENYRIIPTLVDMDTSVGYSSFAVRPLEVFIKVDVGVFSSVVRVSVTMNI